MGYFEQVEALYLSGAKSDQYTASGPSASASPIPDGGVHDGPPARAAGFGPKTGIVFLVSFGVGIAAWLIACLCIRQKYSKAGKAGAGAGSEYDYNQNGVCRFLPADDRLVNTFTTSRIIETRPPEGYGGSGGHSHGGGGRKF